MKSPARAAPADVLDYLDGQRAKMVHVLERMTLSESPSDDPNSQHEIREIIASELEQRGFIIHRVPGKTSGGMLHARPQDRQRGKPAQLILGHYDTVWPVGTLADMPFEYVDDTVKGPGVYDMKGGVAQALLAIDALQHFGLEPEVTPELDSSPFEKTPPAVPGRYAFARHRRPPPDRIAPLQCPRQRITPRCCRTRMPPRGARWAGR